jgi:MOSC domain-containing protein YiiM
MKVLAVNISHKKGIIKVPVEQVQVKIDHGIIGDAHAGNWHRQISLLGIESFHKMDNKGVTLKEGIFAENITTEGIILHELPIGTQLQINDTILEVTQIGKECHHNCAIRNAIGDCVMPREGIFCKVIKEGTIKKDDSISIIEK